MEQEDLPTTTVRNKANRLFRLTGFEPYTRKDGTEMTLAVWSCACTACGAPMQTKTAAEQAPRGEHAPAPYAIAWLDKAPQWCSAECKKNRPKEACDRPWLAEARAKGRETLKARAEERRKIKAEQKAAEKAARAAVAESKKAERNRIAAEKARIRYALKAPEREAAKAQRKAEREAKRAQEKVESASKKNGAKLSDQDVIDLRCSLFLESWKWRNPLIFYTKLAQKHGVAQATMLKIIRGEDRDLEKDPATEDAQYRALREAETLYFLTVRCAGDPPLLHDRTYQILMRGNFRRLDDEQKQKWIKALGYPPGWKGY